MSGSRKQRPARHNPRHPENSRRSPAEPSADEKLSEAENYVREAVHSGSACTFHNHRLPPFALIFQTTEEFPHPVEYFRKLLNDEYADIINNSELTELQQIAASYTHMKSNSVLDAAGPSLLRLCVVDEWRKIPKRASSDPARYLAIVPIANAFHMTAYEPLNRPFICWFGLAHRDGIRVFQIPRPSERIYRNSKDLHESVATLRVRGEFLSKLIRDGIGIRGINICGSWIDGDVNLIDADIRFPLHITNTIISGDFLGYGAKLGHVNLQSTSLISFKADGCTISGSLFMRKGFEAIEGVRLVSARIDGSIDLGESKFFAAKDEIALFLAYTTVGGTAHINGSQIHGLSQLNDMKVERNLDFEGTNIFTDSCSILFDSVVVGGSIKLGAGFACTGPIQMNRARIGRDLDFTAGTFSSNRYSKYAIIVDGSRIDGVLFVRGARLIKGALNFAYSHANIVSDFDLSAWMQATELRLDGFTYDRIDGDIDVPKRVAWLDKVESDGGSSFFAQPWEQLTKTLNSLGYKIEARSIAIGKEDRIGKGRIIPSFGRRSWHRLFGWIAGYGYEPFRVVKLMIATWLISSLVYLWADRQAAIGPSNALIFNNKSIARDCGWTKPGATAKKVRWTVCGSVPQEYTTFNAFFYSLDLILPLVDLQQDRDWSPMVTEPDGVTMLVPGAIARFVMWSEILLGWFFSLIFVAALSGLTKNEE